MKFSKFLIMLIAFVAIPTFAFSQTETVTSPSMVGFVLNGVIGAIVFYGTKIVKVLASGKFDFAYWWKDNALSAIVSFVSIVLISVLNIYQPGALNSLLTLIGIQVDVTSGSIGTIAFGTFLAGTVNEFIKQLTKKTVVTTDGNGNKIND